MLYFSFPYLLDNIFKVIKIIISRTCTPHFRILYLYFIYILFIFYKHYLREDLSIGLKISFSNLQLESRNGHLRFFQFIRFSFINNLFCSVVQKKMNSFVFKIIVHIFCIYISFVFWHKRSFYLMWCNNLSFPNQSQPTLNLAKVDYNYVKFVFFSDFLINLFQESIDLRTI